ncbi:MAG: acyloxyacyl hydrolase [Alphaproteobacteria bacterium]
MTTNLENSGAAPEGTAGINIEFLFARYNTPQADPVTTFVLSPRLHLGTTIAPDGISEIYAGFTWEHHFASRLFFETSLGGAVHDGPTADNNADSYGCPLLFRESASLGFDITNRVRILATVDHISNAGLCSENQGLTNAGVRLGYRW